MKKSLKIYSAIALASTMAFSSCIEETQPMSSTATAEQISASSAALEAAANGIPSQMSQGYLVYGSQVHETDMGYAQFMIGQTEALGDMYCGGSNSGYDWYIMYNTLERSIGPNSYMAYLPWFTLYTFIKSDNDIISIAKAGATADQRKYAGIAYTCRAFNYFMLMSFYEPVENDYTDVSAVKDLTVPFVFETTTADDAKNNPRVSHREMTDSILSDLDKAEKFFATDNNTTNRQLPSLAVAYGVKAKVYMWDQDYENAAKYARMAINESGATPMTEDEWTNPTKGFTTACNGWMWYSSYSAENMGNLCNFVGWMSNEADWGYASLTQPVIDRSLYDRIGATDFRKHVFLDPDKSNYYNYQTCRDKEHIDETLPAYAGLKFRCKDGDWENYKVGGLIDLPIMRIEEMYFIEAIATASINNGARLEEGKTLLNNFMRQYRDPNFSAKSTSMADFQKEALYQMRIEFWGEGNAFPIAKRLKVGCMQNYEGTNAKFDVLKVNCKDIKPSWNYVIPTTEIQANSALEGKNNPDPSQTVVCPSPLGQYGAAKKK